MNPIGIDEAMELAGTFGCVQIVIFLFVSLCGLPISFQMLHMVFIGARPKFICETNSTDITNSSNQCIVNGEECKSFRYTSNFTSIATEWDLVCSNAFEDSLGQSILMAGVLTGAAIFGPIADLFGRKRCYFISLFCAMLSSTASAFSTNLPVFLAGRFLAGVNTAGVILSAFVLLMEVVGPEWRAFCSLVSPTVGSLGISLMAILAYFIRDWRHLSLVFAASGYVFLPFFSLILESPRWLYGRNRVEEAENLLMKIARKNGRVVQEIRLKPHYNLRKESPSAFHVLKNLTLLRVTAIQLYSWMINCIVYYGTTMGAGDLGGNMYLSVILSGIIEIPASLLVLFVLKFVGRRTACCSFMTLGSIACLSIMLIPSEDVYTINALALTGKLSISASFGIIYLWSSEIFPTVIRNSAMGWMSMGARLGGIVAPFINLLTTTNPGVPYLLFGLLALSAAILNFFLPETRFKCLPQSIEDTLKLCGVHESDRSTQVDTGEQTLQLLGEDYDENDETVLYDRFDTTAF